MDCVLQKCKTYITCDSHVVPHRSTEQAQGCLTSEFGWDPVLSPWYERMMGAHAVDRLVIDATNPVCLRSPIESPTQKPSWRNWIAHQTSNLGVAGSNPAGGVSFLIWIQGLCERNRQSAVRSKKGTTGFEPVTRGSAIHCSATELCTHCYGSHSVSSLV